MAFIQGKEKRRNLSPFTLDPRTKLLMLLASSFLSVVITDALFLFFLFEIIIIMTLFSKTDFAKIWRYVKPTVLMVIPIFIIQLFFFYDKTNPVLVIPENWGKIGNVVLISVGSIEYAFSISFRILILALASCLFSLTTDSSDFLYALRRIGIPYEVAFTTGLVIYFFPMVVTETTIVRTSLETRGVSLRKGNFKVRLSTFRILVMSILMNFIEKSKYQAIAMDSRCFNMTRNRSSLKIMRFRFSDLLFMILTVAFTAVMIYLFKDQMNFLENIWK
ncbi:MAG: energy-coupling factor transporter transmembrane component T family protein [Candidatus Heimdallarchaeota archaeon]